MTATLPRSVRSYHVNSGDGIDGLSLRTADDRAWRNAPPTHGSSATVR